ncbi:MAG: hypothetical protein IJG37_04035 [Synergistaceae bacterium]|nr:hypothetical protein [Synergistaceae bacterium]MBQ3654330.1 hypothetical protein [Synergistaceae bacterium]
MKLIMLGTILCQLRHSGFALRNMLVCVNMFYYLSRELGELEARKIITSWENLS